MLTLHTPLTLGWIHLDEAGNTYSVFFTGLELDLDSGGDHSPGDLAAILLSDARQMLLDEPVQHPVLLANVVSHHRLPVWVMFVFAAWLRADVGLLGWQL